MHLNASLKFILFFHFNLRKNIKQKQHYVEPRSLGHLKHYQTLFEFLSHRMKAAKKKDSKLNGKPLRRNKVIVT